MESCRLKLLKNEILHKGPFQERRGVTNGGKRQFRRNWQLEKEVFIFEEEGRKWCFTSKREGYVREDRGGAAWQRFHRNFTLLEK